MSHRWHSGEPVGADCAHRPTLHLGKEGGGEGRVRERLVDIITHISHIHYADVAHAYAYLLHRIQSHSSVSTRNQYL
mgnify:CR=1 FL=1